MKITVQNRPSYGKDRIYPVCDGAKEFAKFTGRACFTEEDLETIRKLGFDVAYLPVGSPVDAFAWSSPTPAAQTAHSTPAKGGEEQT